MPKLDNMQPTETYVEIAAILDRSGSMGGKEEDVIGGYNQFIEDQKKVPGKAKLTTVLFDSEYEFVDEGSDLDGAQRLTPEIYSVRGLTAYYDAMGRTISNVRSRIAGMSEKDRPHKVIVMVITDGLENVSREFSGERLKGLMGEVKNDGWEFMFLAAGDEAIDGAKTLGFDCSHVAKYTDSKSGTSMAYGAVSASISRSRGMIGKSRGFDGIKTEEDVGN